MVVEADDAELELEDDHEHLIDSTEAPTGPYEGYVRDHDVYAFDDEGVSEAHRVRYVEHRVECDDEVSVYGPSRAGATDVAGARAVVSASESGGLDRFLSKPFVVSDAETAVPDALMAGLLMVSFGGIFVVVGVSATAFVL